MPPASWETLLTSCINSSRGIGCGTQLLSNYAVDIHFLTNDQTMAEIMPRITRPGADPPCVMCCPDQSHAVSERMKHSNSAFRTASQKDQENQWSGFLLPLWRYSDDLHSFYSWTAGPTPLAMEPSMVAQPCSPFTLWPLLSNTVQSKGDIMAWWAQHVQGCGKLVQVEPNIFHIQNVISTLCICDCQDKEAFAALFFSLSKTGETVSQIYDQFWI